MSLDELFESPVDFNSSQTATCEVTSTLTFESPVDFNSSQTRGRFYLYDNLFESPVDFNSSQTLHWPMPLSDRLRAL